MQISLVIVEVCVDSAPNLSFEAGVDVRGAILVANLGLGYDLGLSVALSPRMTSLSNNKESGRERLLKCSRAIETGSCVFTSAGKSCESDVLLPKDELSFA